MGIGLMSLKSEVSLNPRHKKRRPRTSFFVDLVEPGSFELVFKVFVLQRFLSFLKA